MSNVITLPGLIDIHVHLRDPGQTQKEDLYSGTMAALAGGFTTVIDMPNNIIPITTAERLQEKIKLAQGKIVCDTGFHFGSVGDNIDEFEKIIDKVVGIKLYLNFTTGNFILTQEKVQKIYNAWPKTKPILAHAEADVIDFVIELVRKTKKKTHICHVSSAAELSAIIKAKREGLPITCGVTPHHLFLTEEEEKRLGALGKMKPSLKTIEDVTFLWKNLGYIDIVESDHAPHTLQEKESIPAPFGVPGLETTLPLLLTAAHEERLSIDTIKDLCFNNPKRIFNIPTEDTTFIEVSDEEYVIENKTLKTKCGWSPFEGKRVKGKVKRVFLRGQKVYENGRTLVEPGSAKIIRPSSS